MELLFSIIAFIQKDESFLFTAYYCLIAAVIFASLSIITGLFDLLVVQKEKPSALNKALTHGGINSFISISYIILAFIAYKEFPVLSFDNKILIAIKTVLVAFLFAGNYLGGSLVLDDKIGVSDKQ
jgi:uncharacterized membrane protein